MHRHIIGISVNLKHSTRAHVSNRLTQQTHHSQNCPLCQQIPWEALWVHANMCERCQWKCAAPVAAWNTQVNLQGWFSHFTLPQLSRRRRMKSYCSLLNSYLWSYVWPPNLPPLLSSLARSSPSWPLPHQFLWVLRSSRKNASLWYNKRLREKGRQRRGRKVT